MLTSRAIAFLAPSSLLFIACDAALGPDGAGVTQEEAALEATILRDGSPNDTTFAEGAPVDGPAAPAPVCLPLSAFGSDMDQIDACMDCVEGARCTVDQFDAGCCGAAIAPSGTSPAPSPSPASDAAIDAGGGGAAGGLDLPPPAPPLGPRSSG